MFYLVTITICWGWSTAFNKSRPISLGVWILFLSFFISLLVGSIFFSWFGFVIFLIYIGGILVIFSYFVAIQPDQKIKSLKYPVGIALGFRGGPEFVEPLVIDGFSVGGWWVRSLFYIKNLPVLIILALVLFLALVRVVKISLVSRGPLRPFIS